MKRIDNYVFGGRLLASLFFLSIFSGCDCLFHAKVLPIHSETGEVLREVKVGGAVYWDAQTQTFQKWAYSSNTEDGWIEYSAVHGRCNQDKVIVYKEGFEPLKMKLAVGAQQEVKLTPIK